MNTIEAAYLAAKEAAMNWANDELAKEYQIDVMQVPYKKAINPQAAMRWQNLVSEYIENNFIDR